MRYELLKAHKDSDAYADGLRFTCLVPENNADYSLCGHALEEYQTLMGETGKAAKTVTCGECLDLLQTCAAYLGKAKQFSTAKVSSTLHMRMETVGNESDEYKFLKYLLTMIETI